MEEIVPITHKVPLLAQEPALSNIKYQIFKYQI
jgi:hypothetical protein